jgi:hypothetical protein
VAHFSRVTCHQNQWKNVFFFYLVSLCIDVNECLFPACLLEVGIPTTSTRPRQTRNSAALYCSCRLLWSPLTKDIHVDWVSLFGEAIWSASSRPSGLGRSSLGTLLPAYGLSHQTFVSGPLVGPLRLIQPQWAMEWMLVLKSDTVHSLMLLGRLEYIKLLLVPGMKCFDTSCCISTPKYSPKCSYHPGCPYRPASLLSPQLWLIALICLILVKVVSRLRLARHSEVYSDGRLSLAYNSGVLTVSLGFKTSCYLTSIKTVLLVNLSDKYKWRTESDHETDCTKGCCIGLLVVANRVTSELCHGVKHFGRRCPDYRREFQPWNVMISIS